MSMMSMDASQAAEWRRRLPLPLAQLWRRAHAAKTARERVRTVLDAWQCAVKLLASVAAVELLHYRNLHVQQEGGAAYALRLRPFHQMNDPGLAERLACLVRPTLSHWWEAGRVLVPAVAAGGDPAFQTLRDRLFGKTMQPLPRLAEFEASLYRLGVVAPRGGGAGGVSRLSEFFDLLAALCQDRDRSNKPKRLHETADAALAFLDELFESVDFLAGRRLIAVADVRRMKNGGWLVERLELIGERARRIESLEFSEAEEKRLPQAGWVCLEPIAGKPGVGTAAAAHAWGTSPLPLPQPLTPLAVFAVETEEYFFLRAKPGSSLGEYLCFTSGNTLPGPAWQGENAAFLGRLTDTNVDAARLQAWIHRACADDPTLQDRPTFTFRTLGPYELLSEVRRGPGSVVYRAWQPSLRRQLALECTIRPGDPRTEAELRCCMGGLVCVDHPALAKTFSLHTEGDVLFVATEQIDEPSLRSVHEHFQATTPVSRGDENERWQQSIRAAWSARTAGEKLVCEQAAWESRAHPTPMENESPARGEDAGAWPRRLVDYIRQAATTVHALHEAGLVHRNIRPDTLMVSADGRRIVLAAPGLPPILDALEGRLTRTHQLGGALRFVSPEQALSVGAADARSDVYSLGAVLWELLANQSLFGATDQTPTPDVIYRIQYEEPENLRRCCPCLPAELESIVMKCLRKDPQQRWGSARELAEALASFLRSPGCSASSLPDAAATSAVPLQAGRLLDFTLPLSPPTAAALSGSAIAAASAPLPPRGPDRGMPDAPAHAFALREEALLFGSAAEATESTTSAAVATTGAAVVMPAPAQEPARQGKMRRGRQNRLLFTSAVCSTVGLAALAVWFGIPSVFHFVFQADSETAAGNIPPPSAAATDNAGEMERLRGLWNSEKRRADDLAAELRKALLLAETERVRAEANAAEALTWRHRAEHAERSNSPMAGEELRRLREQAEKDRQHIAALAQEAEQHKLRADAAVAELARSRQPAEVVAHAAAFTALDSILGKLAQDAAWRYPAYEALHKRTAAAARAALQELANHAAGWSEEHKGRLQARLAWLHFELGSPREAEEGYLKALAHLNAAAEGQGKERASVQEALAEVHELLGRLYRAQGAAERAEAAFQQSAAVWEALGKANPQHSAYAAALAGVQDLLGQLYQAGEKSPQAEAAYQKALAIRDQLRQAHPQVIQYQDDLAQSHHQLGMLWEQNGSIDKAEASHQQGIGIREKLVRAYPKETHLAVSLAVGCLEYGGLLQDAGKLDEALGWYTKSIEAVQGVLDAEKHNPKARRTLSKAYRNRAQVQASMGRPTEALPDWDAAIAYEDGDQTHLRCRRALTYVQLGEPERAAGEADQLVRSHARSPGVHYNAACVFSLASEAARKDPKLKPQDQARLADLFAKRAVELLQTAHLAGYFRDAGRLNTLRTDADLHPLRQREDFRKFMAVLEK